MPPPESRPSTFTSRGSPRTLIVVSRPFQWTVRTGASALAPGPARMRQATTCVAPFQIAWTVVVPSAFVRAVAVGCVSGWPAHSCAVGAVGVGSRRGALASKSSLPCESNSERRARAGPSRRRCPRCRALERCPVIRPTGRRGCATALSNVAVFVVVSRWIQITRDCGSDLIVPSLSLSKRRIVFSPAGSGLCCQANRTPAPSVKSLCLPPSRQRTWPVCAVDLVDRPGVPARDEQVAVVVEVDGVDVEVVVGVALGHRRVAVVERHVVEAVPLEEDPAGCDVDLLDDRRRRPCRRFGPPTEERSYGTLVVDRDQRRPLRCQCELVPVGVEAVAGMHGRDDVIRAVDDVVDVPLASVCDHVSTGWPR